MRFVVVATSRSSIRVEDAARRAEFQAHGVFPDKRAMQCDPEIGDDDVPPDPGEVVVLETWGFPGGGGSRALPPTASDVVAARRAAPSLKLSVSGAWNPASRR